MPLKPRVFIASSTEGMEQAHAIFSCLESETEPSLWIHNIFEPSSTLIESLEQALQKHDAGVVVLTPDDTRRMRGVEAAIPRDNVIFELGLLMGKLGRRNVFLVLPDHETVSLPTDLTGIVQLTYRSRADANFVAAVSTACRRIVDALADSRGSSVRQVSLWSNVQQRHRDGTDLRSQVEKAQRRVFVSGISLRYLVNYSRHQLRDALSRGVVVEILVSAANSYNELYDLYKPHSEAEINFSHLAWKEFSAELSREQQDLFSVFATPVLLTHSIGLYDKPMFVNPFCIGIHSSDLPSIEISPDVQAYWAYVQDAVEHINRGERLCGNGGPSFLQNLRETEG